MVEVILDLISLLEHKWVVELEDANIHAVIVVVERVKRVDMDASAHVNVLVDASVLPALAVLVNDSAALKGVMVEVVGVKV